MKLLHHLLRRWMARIEEAMIRRLLRQRDNAWAEADAYKRAMGLRLGGGASGVRGPARGGRLVSDVRTYRVGVKGFDFDFVFVRASSRGRARTICARAFAEAGWGTQGDGYKSLTFTRLDDTDVELVHHRRGDEGLAVARHAFNAACPETGLPCDQQCPDPDCFRMRKVEES